MRRDSSVSLVELYPSSADLIRERFGTIFETKRIQAKEFTPNIDNASLAVDTSVENTLHSYFMLFCRRCHRYDCFLHKDKQATPDLKVSSTSFNPVYRPCSRQCYRNKPSVSYQQQQQQQRRTRIELKRSHSELADISLGSGKSSTNGCYSKRLKKPEATTSSLMNLNFPSNGFLFKPTLKRKSADDSSQWSASDKSLFRVLFTIYSDNLCLIADLLEKTCSQVYTFYSSECQSSESDSYFLQRQISTNSSSSTLGSFSALTTSSDSTDMKINGDHSKTKVNGNGKHSSSQHDDESVEDEKPLCNGKDESLLVGGLGVDSKADLGIFYSSHRIIVRHRVVLIL